ncbi:glutamate-1-semialdehyde 2,1-aminomutase [Kineosporia sp. A_224]|uniref:glutamate-1-semialdehyde 2,1-aminomutase n=1 Tax=Kineosporia sp. A_224 TaxID=1962180 RepID=UPI000B4A867F|nr:glutamate-1-semialdehyde 2,1-aminomutase [Kineosporia sp. A_224]
MGRRIFSESVRLGKQLDELVPGGAHTYAKGADQYPQGMAPVVDHGLGAHVWDVDGNRYVEYGSGLRSVALGHAHPRVVGAAAAAMARGTNFCRPSALEAQAAETLLSLVPGADMVKFAKNGSDATTGALRLARAATGRDLVAVCRDHPFFSVDDWFIGTTPMHAGIPESVRAQTLMFRYGDLDDVRRLLEAHRGQVAALFLEGVTQTEPPAGWAQGLRSLCDEHGTLLVVDEMINGFRLALGGAQELYPYQPDLSAFGKAMGNGFAVSALAGRREHMRLGGAVDDADRVFLLSTTHGAETHGLAAFLAVVDVYREEDVVRRLHATGELLRSRVTDALRAAGVAEHVRLLGLPPNLVHATLDADGERSQAFRTLFLQELLDRGVVAPSFVVSAALTEDDVAATADAVHEAGLVYRRALDEGVARHLRGRPVRPAIRARG